MFAAYYTHTYDPFFVIPLILLVWYALDGWAKDRDARINRERRRDRDREDD